MRLLKAGPKSQAAVCAAGAIATLVSHNGINQDAVADNGGVEALTELLAAAVKHFPDGLEGMLDDTQADLR